MTSVCLVADCLKSYDKYRDINVIMRLGPTLTGEKPMHIFFFNKGFKFINEILNDIELLFSQHSSIRYQLVYSHNESIKVIFYNKHTMNRLLNDQRIQRFLSSHGYELNSKVDMYMNHLADSLKDNVIPSEFGVFFGYPVKDVMGFIGHPSLQHVKTTAWKVYGNPDPSDLILKQFDAAEKKVLELCQSLPLKSVISELEALY